MCGLVGVAGRIFHAEKKAFKFLHQFDETRGEHSSGMAVIGDKGSIDVFKKVGIPHDLWRAEPTIFDDKDHVYKSNNVKVMIGHNRYATMGAKVDKNAHPFHHGNIVGAHNGTLSSHWLHKLDGYNKFDVDSEAIFYSLNKNGLEKTMDTLHGAWALTWWDASNNTMNFIRNKERPLNFMWSKDRQTIFWASEPWMLLAALYLAKIDTGDEKVHAFTPDRHYHLELGAENGNIKDKTIHYSQETYTGFQSPVWDQGSTDYYGSWMDEAGYNGYSPYGNSKTTSVTAKPKGNKQQANIYEVINAEKDRAVALVDKEVEFWIYGERKSPKAGTYLLADCHGLPDSYEIRMYCSGHKRFAEWQVSNLHYKGVIRGHTVQWDHTKNKMARYLIIDLRTVSEGFEEDEEPKKEEPKKFVPKVINNPNPIIKPEEIINLRDRLKVADKEEAKVLLPKDLEWNSKRTYTGYLGATLSFTEMMQAVNRGCIVCGEKIAASEADDVMFVQPGRFLCTICKNNQENIKLYTSKK